MPDNKTIIATSNVETLVVPEPTLTEVEAATAIKVDAADALPVVVGEQLPQTETAGAGPSQKIKVAILTEDGFEESELVSPKEALEGAGATVDVIAPRSGKVKGWNKTDWGREVTVDKTLSDAIAAHYDALVLPGGVMNPDKLRMNKDALLFINHFIGAGKPVAAICHGVQTLIETGLIAGTTMTSYPSLQTDMRNAGVNWTDQEMVHYGQYITSRRPDDLPAFNAEIISTLGLKKG